MQFPRMLLILSTLIAVAISYPTGKNHGNSTDSSKIAIKVSNTSNSKPIMVAVKEKNPNFGSVLIEFVYNGNSIPDSTAVKKSRYAVGSQKNDNINNKKINLNKKENNSTLKAKETETKKEKDQINATKPVKNLKAEESFENVGVTSLNEELSPLFGKVPKYFFDTFNPLQPFPELQYQKPNQLQAKKVQNPITDIYFSLNEKEQKSQDTAGPHLNPLSIYEREFRQPIFD